MTKYYADVLTKVKRDEYDTELIKLIYRAYYYAEVISYCMLYWEHNSHWSSKRNEAVRRLRPSEHICNLQMRNKGIKGGYYCLDKSGESMIRFVDNRQGEFSLSNLRYHFSISPHGFHPINGAMYNACFDITIRPGSKGKLVSFFPYTQTEFFTFDDVMKPGSMLWLYITLLKRVCDKIRATIKMAIPMSDCRMVLSYKK